ncbi:hypothetical protein IWW39_003851 [Coemansia spiralis]|uniref:RING-type E3 ubiquitin transferase n=1 Tax=Coemansia spiralis TaxID=417178 RepID=A0A9W8GHT1_9FUNG|nr:hypothetical protein IWW39_003851 [Coemansia spiralis]
MEHDEVPICRVCRGEATAEEPLFYPCRCSGSIKYVHQDCLEEWLAHSNKRYCELCKHEYAFTPVYDPNMPETIPKSIIVRQMVSNVMWTILMASRAALVMAVWFLVLPYIVYWMTRFYFWSGGQSSLRVAGTSVDSSNNNATEAVVYAVSPASVRFVGFSSWHEWYNYARVNSTVTPIVSRTGVLDGATSVVLILYTVTRLVIKPSSLMLCRALGVRVSDEWIDEAVDSVAELAAKCIEGGVVTVTTIVLFMALFILRDWIYANAPVQENFVEDPVAEEPVPPEPAIQQLRVARDAQAELPRLNVVQAQPVVVENPHHRPLFERLALLDDHLPDEQPVPVHRRRVSSSSSSNSDDGQPGRSASTRNHDSFGLQDDEYADEADNAWSLVSSNESSPPFVPPTFTSESSRSIAARVGFDRPSDSSSDGESEDGGGEARRPLFGSRRHADPLTFDFDMPPNPRREEEEDHVAPEAVAADPGPELEPEPEPVAAAAAIDDDDNFGEPEMGEGMLEAMGFRGRAMDAAQYFVLVLSMVSVVLATLAWVPFIIGRAFASLNPIRWALYAVYVCTAAVDAASEFVLDRLLAVAEAGVNMLGPAAALFVPGMRGALQADGSLWDWLGAAAVRGAALERVQQSWAVRAVFPWVSASLRPTPTSGCAALDLAALAGLSSGERDVWRRFVRWGIPVDRAAAALQQAAAGATLGQRLAMVGAGHAVVIAAAWVFVAHAPPGLRRTAAYAQARVVVLMAKIAYFIFVELALFPALCGLCVTTSVAPVLQLPALWAGGAWAWGRVAVYWVVGLGFMIHFARFVLYCRQILRPGVLWFIRDPNDPAFHPMREILEDRMAPQQYKIGRSAVMYCGIIGACVLAPAHMAACVAPEGLLPVAWAGDADFWRASGAGRAGHACAFGVAVLLPVLFAWGRPYAVAQAALGRWWRVAARVARLTEFMLGERDVLDEGRWVLRAAPWLPSCVARLWAPADDVRGALAALGAVDEARAGRVEAALPTDAFRRRLQAAADRVLAASAVQFVLDGGNLRVPAIDTVPVVAGRRMLVPIDGHGRPADARHDYEAADHPDVRAAGLDPGLLPAPAPESSYRDQRFKREDHTVVYAPPALRARLALFLALGWAAIAGAGIAVLMLALASGRAIGRRISMGEAEPAGDVLALGIGLFCVVAGCAAASGGAELVAMVDAGDGEGFAAAALRAGRRVWAYAWRAAVVTVVFIGAVPLVYGLVVEVYAVVVFRRALQGLGVAMDRNLVAAMVHNWPFSLLQLGLVRSVLRLFPQWRVSREMERVFAGDGNEWLVWRAVLVFGLPAIGLSLAVAGVPFALAAAMMWRNGELTGAGFMRVVALDDIELLAFASKTFLLSCLGLAAVWHACLLYKRWTRLARDRVYLVGQRLHNLPAAADEAAGVQS